MFGVGDGEGGCLGVEVEEYQNDARFLPEYVCKHAGRLIEYSEVYVRCFIRNWYLKTTSRERVCGCYFRICN